MTLLMLTGSAVSLGAVFSSSKINRNISRTALYIRRCSLVLSASSAASASTVAAALLLLLLLHAAAFLLLLLLLLLLQYVLLVGPARCFFLFLLTLLRKLHGDG